MRELYQIIFFINKRKLSLYQKKIINSIKKENINVVFFVNSKAKWQYDELYHLMEAHKNFTPWVVVVPNTSWGVENALFGIKNTLKEFDGYRVISSLNKNNIYQNIKKTISPNIVFFSEPSGGHYFYKPYYFYKQSLCCYVPYNINIDKSYSSSVTKPFYGSLWASFTETKINQSIASNLNNPNSKKFKYTGYPPMDVFLHPKGETKDPWVKTKSYQNRIIWAPHHTIDDPNNSASFLKFYQFFLDLAQKKSDSIYITFKPHPLLKYKLYQLSNWGKNKTDEYYNKWEKLENGQLTSGNYFDLFKYSDALIHDGFSFAVEYIYVNKPICFTLTNKDLLKNLNELGEQAINVSYQATNKNEILNFIDNIIIKNDDLLKVERESFLNQILLPPNGNLASKNIMDYICKNLNIPLNNYDFSNF